MHPADLPDLLADRGVRLGYRLTLDAPKGAVDATLRRHLERFKPLLAEALARADRLGLGPERFADVLPLDADGFDWGAGEATGVPTP
jgi:hypothetical protein